MFSFFRKKDETAPPHPAALRVDMHAHFLPGIDDGAETMEQSIAIVRQLQALGYQKLVATPHVMGDFYRNTPDTIFAQLMAVRKEARRQGINLALEAAAEYYLDEWFMQLLQRDTALLPFGTTPTGLRYVLFEVSYINPAPQLGEAIFLMKAAGYQPVLAHPERYLYFLPDFEKLKKIYDSGVLFQLNINSLTGYYSRGAQQLAEKLIDNRMVQFLGTDCHAERQANALQRSQVSKYYRKALELPLLNNTLHVSVPVQ